MPARLGGRPANAAACEASAGWTHLRGHFTSWTLATGGAQTDAFVTNAGIVFLIGQTGGQWVDESGVTIDGRTGEKLPQVSTFWNFYGTQSGVFADRPDKVFLMVPSNSNSYPYPPTYPSAYKRFSGSLLLPDGELTLPQVNGAASYGIKIFHSAAGSHVVLVQTGTNEERGPGAQYHVIVR